MKKKMKRDIKTEIERIKKKLKENCDCEECNIERARLPLLEVLSKSLTPKEAGEIIKKNIKICEGWGESGKKSYNELVGYSSKGGIFLTSINSCATINKFLIDLFAKKNVKLEKEAKPLNQI
jgi:hypothetical protein